MLSPDIIEKYKHSRQYRNWWGREYPAIINKIIEPPHSRRMFLKKIKQNGTLLDVGCGNNSPYIIKTILPNIEYTGIDVGDYHQTEPNLADNYIITTPDKFADTIENINISFDTVISSHNLEHCDERDKVLYAMIKVLKQGGYLYLSFPTEKSVKFPGPRRGTLNYYDDGSHKDVPPNFNKVIQTLEKENIQIIFKSKAYKPFFMFIIGMLAECKSKKTKIVRNGTWAYWGFETVIWARKKYRIRNKR
ncbi:hypothetical protein AGMMS50230_16640 [Spirochaetia bacterium]|nr:hypothetical protein AGMMS50230_16640 [Spirochaetia bacterium]